MVNITTPLLLIGAALSRTGTMSTKAALERMGYKVWHGTLLLLEPKWYPFWRDIAESDLEGDAARYNRSIERFIHELSLDNYTAIIDRPGAHVYQDLMRFYPDAKVLNTKRNPERWALSMVEMVHSLDVITNQPPFSLEPESQRNYNVSYWMLAKMGIDDSDIYPMGVPFNGSNPVESKSSISLETAVAAYHRYQAEVKASVPPERLVEWSVQDGWEPLCREFALDGEECPVDEPFPRVNSKEDGLVRSLHLFLNIKIVLYKMAPWLATDAVAFLLFSLMQAWQHAVIGSGVALLLAIMWWFRKSKSTSAKHKTL